MYLSIRGLLKFKLFLFLPVLSMVLVGCKGGLKSRDFSEGIIEYNVTYIGNENDTLKVDSNTRPDRMVVRFKNNNTLNRIEAFSGAFSFSFIQDIDSESNITLMKILNKKIYYKEPIQPGRYHFAYDAMPKLTFQETEQTEEYLGLTCHRVFASAADSSNLNFEILYTKDIHIQKPNYNSPFEEIDGIMLKFSVILFNQKMSIVASSIKPAKLSKDEFCIPNDYEQVDEATMREVVYLFQ